MAPPSRAFTAVAAGLFLAVTPARAEPPRDPARADALFQEGKGLLETGKVAQACERLTQSDALDPTVSALGLLAGCHEQQGRVATAWKEYLVAAKRAEATKDERGAFAQGRAAALEPTLPRLLVSVAHAPPGLELESDGERFPPGAPAELRVDPGPHTIVARAPDRQTFAVTVIAKVSERVAVDVPELPPLHVAPPPVLLAPVASPPAAPSRAPGLVVGALGLVGIGVGLTFGASAISMNNESRTIHETCVSAAECERGRSLRASAYTSATISTVGFGAGLVGLGVGAVLLLRGGGERAAPARSAFELAPSFNPGGGGASLVGRF